MTNDKNPGPGVDAQGQPVVDPTQNVLDLVQAAIQRQDDLRKAERDAVRRESDLHLTYQRELRKAESARIDAIRSVDIGAVTRAAEAQALAAQTLAAQVATTAETFRIALDTSLQKVAQQIAELQRAQYEAQGGKQQVVETRSGRSETRLNLGTLIAIIGSAVTLITFFVFMANMQR